MSVLRFDNVSKQYAGGHDALSEVSFAVGAGRDAVRHRPFRRRQEHAAQADPSGRTPQPRRGAVRREEPGQGARRPRRAAPARGRRRLPGPSPADRPQRRRQRRAAADPARHAPRRDRQARAQRARQGRPRRARERACRRSCRPASSSASASPARSSASRALLVADEPTGNLDPDPVGRDHGAVRSRCPSAAPACWSPATTWRWSSA